MSADNQEDIEGLHYLNPNKSINFLGDSFDANRVPNYLQDKEKHFNNTTLEFELINGVSMIASEKDLGMSNKPKLDIGIPGSI
jgi:hypothetical protein